MVIRICLSFQVNDSLLPYILDTLGETITDLSESQPSKLHLSLQCHEGYIGLSPDESVWKWIAQVVTRFNEKISHDYGTYLSYHYTERKI